MEDNAPFSIQSMLIRQMQVEDGHTPCFATTASNQCADKKCCWRHDCFDEALDIRLRNATA